MWAESAYKLHQCHRFLSAHCTRSSYKWWRRSTPLPWHSAFSWVAPVFKSGCFLLAFGSNPSVKPARLRQLAYLSL
ncbi:DUF1010 domain-containing protein [Comamonas guangdongensis]|uniref:DUF1010 domain-containing protein n=1 Tax=Comamonas guangdongensis TaxID=510515 RepID=A0ABV3ZVS5_9BURK